MRPVLIFCFLAFLLTQAAVLPVRGQSEPNNCGLLSPVDWREARTPSFAILYVAEHGSFADALVMHYGGPLEAEYARFSALFETSLALPITIRIYPSEIHYYCLNPSAPRLAPGMNHSHIGTREIALIGGNILPDLTNWLPNALEIFRYETAILFAEQITNRNAPPGLLAAVGYLAQDPNRTIGSLSLNPGDWLAPTHSWPELWEDEDTPKEFIRGVQAASTTAYLVDVHGWSKFLQFLQGLSTSDAYRHPLSQAFGLDLHELEDQWRAYYRLFFSGRWQANPLYAFDLSPFQELLDAGAYEDASNGLEGVIPFLERSNQSEKVHQADEMLSKAYLGQEAGYLVSQSRQALLNGEYQRAVDLVNEAQRRYGQLRNYRRLDELAGYRNQAERILELHKELDGLQKDVAVRRNTFALSAELSAMAERLGDLGDRQGQLQVRELAEQVQQRHIGLQTLTSAAGALLALALLAYRIWLSRLRPAPEAQL